jgi:hypothetical protein
MPTSRSRSAARKATEQTAIPHGPSEGKGKSAASKATKRTDAPKASASRTAGNRPGAAAALPKREPTAFERWRDTPGSYDDLCAQIAAGDNVWAFTQRHGLPYSTLREWIDRDKDRADKYGRAREDRADKLADEIVAIADEVEVRAHHDGEEVRLEVDPTAVARNRLRVDARKWVAAKLKPRVYGDKTTTEHTGADGGPVQHSLTVTFVDAPPREGDAG